MYFKIYSSSAGSGKTYTLTKEYLKLALQTDNPHYFRFILAITFTNDAANEMKARIVGALLGFTHPHTLSEKKRQESDKLLQSIADELGIQEPVLRKRAKLVFTKIIYNYSDFAVSTIDSFVNKIATAFTQELNIPYNYEVDLDTEKLLQNATDRVLDKVGDEHKEQLSDLVVDWAEKKAEEGKNWGQISPELADFSKDLMNERSYNFINQLKKLNSDDFEIIRTELFEMQRITKNEMVTAAKNALQIIANQGLGATDFVQKTRGVFGYFTKISEGRELDKEANSYVNNAVENGKWASAKSNPAMDAIAPDLAKAVRDIEYAKSMYMLRAMITPHIHKLALIHEVETELEDIKLENNSIHISDTNKKIAEIIATEPVPFIYERVGEKYSHILIDEFQDTSVLQWQNLLPLVENNLAEQNFNLIVGDAKQAIYRWRGGEMEQLVHLYKNNIKALLEPSLAQDGDFDYSFLAERYETLRYNHEPAQLSFNYRSTREVITFNNDFFRLLVDLHQDKYPLLGMIYDAGFEQSIPPQNTKDGGHIEVRFLEREEYQTNTYDNVLATVSNAMAEGFNKRDIAILTRSNADGKEVANYLKSKGIPVISQTSLLLANDDRVHFITAFLKMIKTPHDRLLKSEVLYLFYRVVLQKNPDTHINNTIKQLITRPINELYQLLANEGFNITQTALQQLGLYELVEKLIEVFRLFDNQHRLEYLFRFLDLVLEFNMHKNTTLTDFLEYWDDKKDSVSVNTPKDNDAVTVTTIHKSKGLEFQVVIIPFADWSYAPKPNSTMWVQLPREEFTFKRSDKYLSSSIVRVSSKLEKTIVAEQYKNELEKTFIENFNVLYVAFTRAVDRLYVFCRKENFTKKAPSRVSSLIYTFLYEKKFWEEGVDHYQIEIGQPKTQKKVEEDEDAYFYIDEFVSTDIHKRVRNLKNDHHKDKVKTKE